MISVGLSLGPHYVTLKVLRERVKYNGFVCARPTTRNILNSHVVTNIKLHIKQLLMQFVLNLRKWLGKYRIGPHDCT
jgi:hypothetical protein